MKLRPSSWRGYISGVASDGHLVRPHVVFPSELSPEFRKALLDTYPGRRRCLCTHRPANLEIITDGMAQVTEPGAFHTAGSAHLNGIDFAGKTGTAEVISDAALSQMKHIQGIPSRMYGLWALRRGATRSWWWPCYGSTASSATTRRALPRGS